MIPSAYAEPERYRGRELLIILENYILDCIAALDPQQQQQIQAIVQRVWGGGEDWKQTVRAVLQLGESLDDHLRSMWQQNQKIAKANRIMLVPVQFAKMIADQNFAHLIEPLDPEVGPHET